MNTLIYLSQIIMLKRLDALILIVNNAFNYFFGRIVKLLSLITRGEAGNINLKLFFLEEFQEILCIIAYMIYMEIIELKFCGLDYDLKKNIQKISIKDYKSISEKNNEEDDYDDVNEKEGDVLLNNGQTN